MDAIIMSKLAFIISGNIGELVWVYEVIKVGDVTYSGEVSLRNCGKWRLHKYYQCLCNAMGD